MIKNIVFDLGNVLLNYHPEDFLLQYTSDLKRINAFISKVPRSDAWWQLDRGVMSLENAKGFFLDRYPEESDLLLPFFDHWMEMLTPIENNVKILRELKKNRYKLYILSNFIKEAFEFIEIQYDFFSLFDGRVISSEEKVIKPEKAIYQILLQRYALLPEESLFLDDVPSFLIPAKELGMKTILIRPNKDLRIKLRKLRVII